ncbi:MAG: hypothetical protein OXG05_14470 [Gammaproteobacteria bacterium]|nr:hypothetical protein [Gammaproteobacteria bacterium]
MMSLNRADALRQKLEEKHGFNAEQANGTMMVVDEMVDHGIDRVLKSIADLESKMNARFDVIDERFDVINERFDVINERFKVIDDHLKTIEVWIPVKIGFITIALIAAYAAIFGS